MGFAAGWGRCMGSTSTVRRDGLGAALVYEAFVLWSLYSNASTSAFQLASMMFSLTPIVPQFSCLSLLSMFTRM